MSSVLHVAGPAGAAPGERRQMLDQARSHLDRSGVAADDIVRIDVPGRGGSVDEPSGSLRGELEAVVPMLQSGSLFGGRQGLELVDAQNLLAGEAEIIAGLLPGIDPEALVVVIVSEGALANALKQAVKEAGTVQTVQKIWESNAQRWLDEQIIERGLQIDGGAAAALIQRFGADTASLGQALDQLADTSGRITAAVILDRFRNRPNEPIFHYTDAVAKGDSSEALRRLDDLLFHNHPLVILASLETELRRRSLALAAPDKATLAEWAGAREKDRWIERVWRRRGALRDSSLRRGMSALVRADRILKTQPEELHQVTLERLTVAMCRWMTGK